METQRTIDRIEQLLIKAGAATAANNQESFQEAYEELAGLGAGVDEIQFAVGVGKAVREKPAAAMGKYLEELFGVERVEAAGSKSCPGREYQGRGPVAADDVDRGGISNGRQL